MKKYRLKEEAYQYFYSKIVETFKKREFELEEWNKNGFGLEALEEVPQRVELAIDSMGGLYQKEKSFTDQEKDLCEKALNGELLDIDSIDNDDFDDFAAEYNERNGFDGVSLRLDCYDITVLKGYLKHKQNG